MRYRLRELLTLFAVFLFVSCFVTKSLLSRLSSVLFIRGLFKNNVEFCSQMPPGTRIA